MPHDTLAPHFTSFDGHRLLASGSLQTVALAVRHAAGDGAAGPLLIFDDGTGHSIDIDTQGTEAEVAARFTEPAKQDISPDPATRALADGPRGRGRPRLGVIAREVTLLPRHWEWLAAQPGGASVALRKLVEQARRDPRGEERLREACERAYRFMSAMAGDFPDFEEAIRALFAHDRSRFNARVAAWPADVRNYAIRLAYDDNAEAC